MRRTEMHCWPCLAATAVAALLPAGLAGKTARLAAQGKAATLLVAGFPAPGPRDEDGPPLVLPESTDLNRILRKITEFFAQDPPRWDDGVRMLQDLLEGRVLGNSGSDHVNDPFYSVYSEDQRLYIPFARYCQRLLCRLPSEGLEAYRFLCDGRAREGYDRAFATLDANALQRLAELFFATDAGPDIVMLLADLATLEGDVGRAIHLRTWLLEGYPDLAAETVRVLLLRQAHAYAEIGDRPARDAALAALAARGVSTVRVAGGRVRIDRLADHPAFRVRDQGRARAAAGAPAIPSCGFTSLDLAELWQYAFRSPDPYQLVKPRTNRNRQVFFGGRQSFEMPHRRSFRPGVTTTPFRLGHRLLVAVKDHDRLVLLDSVSGKVRAKSSGKDRFKGGTPQSILLRVPATDFGVQHVSCLGTRLWSTEENRLRSSRSSTEFPFRNRLLAFDAATGRVLWKTETARKSDRIFFQAPPIAFRGRLYAPVRKKRSFCIAELDARTGALVNLVTVHSGGTSLLRVPAVPLVRVGNQLIHLTNAGAVAAFSLPHLELQWLRAYETRTPHQPAPRRSRRAGRNYYYGVRERKLTRWAPVPPIVFRDRILVAPTDANALLCLDAHSGRPVWMLPREERRRGTTFHEVVGHDGGRVYLAGNRLQCIDMASGKRVWEVDLDHLPQGRHTGLGTVAGGHVYLPFPGGVYRFRCADGEADGVIPFPPRKDGEPNWGLPVRLQFAGSVLLAVTEAGVVGYSVPADLVAASEDGWDRARRLAAAGDAEGALDAVAALTASGGEAATVRPREAESFFVRLSGEVALAHKQTGGTVAALAVLDRAARVLEKAGLPPDPRLLLLRISALDAQRDAREIRRLRERVADLDLVHAGAGDGAAQPEDR